MPRPGTAKKIARIKTPRDLVGTDAGLLFQIEAQILEKEKELNRQRGDLSYLQRRKRDLKRKIKAQRTLEPR